jgi:hypothetical protein
MQGAARDMAAQYHDRALRAGHTWAAHRLLGLVEPSWAHTALSFAASRGDVWAEAEAAILLVGLNATHGRDGLHSMLVRSDIPWVLRARILLCACWIFVVEQHLFFTAVLGIGISALVLRAVGLPAFRLQAVEN